MNDLFGARKRDQAQEGSGGSCPSGRGVLDLLQRWVDFNFAAFRFNAQTPDKDVEDNDGALGQEKAADVREHGDEIAVVLEDLEGDL